MQTTDNITGVDVAGMPRFGWNTRWARAGDHDGQPAFHGAGYVLYFCGATQQWVVDSAIDAAGATPLARSATADINSAWTVQPHWRDCPAVRVEELAAGGDVRVSGLTDANGTYSRVSADDAGRARYAKTDPERHLYWDDDGNTWVVAPTPAVGGGVYALSATAALAGAWMTAPADVVAPDVRITPVCDAGAC
jgi:hypothetical protein